ncbi:MAG: FG-GAP repeat domain-containing protein [Nannocystales bacterium]
MTASNATVATLSTGLDGSTGSSTVAVGTDTGPPSELCLRGTPHPALDDVGDLLKVLDTDGNGRDELWTAEERWDPVEEVQSSVLRPFELNDQGVFAALAEVELPGRIEALADIDGDGLLDVVFTQWDEDAPWWQAGLPGFGVDGSSEPLQQLDTGMWMDATGDGRADYVEVLWEGGFHVLVGDGTGAFASAGTSAMENHTPNRVLPVPALNQLVLVFQDVAIGFGTDSTILRTVSVNASGEIQTLAESQALDIAPDFVADLDGDRLADVVGIDAIDGNTLRFLGSADGPYQEVDIVPNVRGAIVGGFFEDAPPEVLWWDSSPHWQLTGLDGLLWPEGPPVTGSPQWDVDGPTRLIEADGEPGTELLQGRETFSLWKVEAC